MRVWVCVRNGACGVESKVTKRLLLLLLLVSIDLPHTQPLDRTIGWLSPLHTLQVTSDADALMRDGSRSFIAI